MIWDEGRKEISKEMCGVSLRCARSLAHLPSCILDTFRLTSRNISPLYRSQSRKLVTLDAIRGLRSPFIRLPMPISIAWDSRKRYNIDCAFSEFRAIVKCRP